MTHEIRWYCIDCFKYVRPYREVSRSEAGDRPGACQNTGCKTGFLNLYPMQVPKALPANLSRNPLITATHDDLSVPGPGYKPSPWRRVLQWFGLAG